MPRLSCSQLNLADAEGWGADPAMQCARTVALALYTDIIKAHSRDSERWASAREPMLAVGRLALPYSLKHLSGWLASGGLALGAPPSATSRYVLGVSHSGRCEHVSFMLCGS